MIDTYIDRTKTNFVAAEPTTTTAITRYQPQQPVAQPIVTLPALPDTGVSQVVRYDVTPQGRAIVLLAKTTALTCALSGATLAAMIVLDTWAFVAWLGLASIEWVATFVFVSIQDYRETPASQQRLLLSGWIRIMEREQKTRLRAQYGEVIE